MRATQLNTAVFAFGRMNPPTIGHSKLVDMVKQQPGKHFVFLTHTQKPKTDPLTYAQKVKYAKQTFSGVSIGDDNVKTIIQALQKLESMGYVNVILVVGSDRVDQFNEFINKYNGKDYKFDSVKVVSAGERDPDSDGVEGMSASKMRQFAQQNDFENFRKGVVNQSTAQDMYNDVRSGMGITEIMGFATINESLNFKPDVYVDMDGVIADFFSALAKFRGVDHWKDGGDDSVQDSINAIQGTNFFSTLPVFPTAQQLISTVKSFTGGEWHICSSPLRGDHENSKKHKIAWLVENGFTPTSTIITGRKESHATTKDSTNFRPNILIDDKPSNIQRWQGSNGIGIRYQANKDSISRIQTALNIVKNYINKKTDPWTTEEIKKLNNAVDNGTVMEMGRVVKGVNTTIDVGVDAIRKQSAKMGFTVSKDGVPPNINTKKRLINVLKEDEFKNKDGKYSLTGSQPETQKWKTAKQNSKPGTLDWFKTWRTLPLLTKGRKNHYMPPVKEKLEALQHNLELLEKYSKQSKLTEAEFEQLAEKQDACYHKVKSRYKVWPSAYASGALVKCRKVGAKSWGNKSKKK
jgi:nicotinic acid mononucleotide adenylyltransferase|tara:strand:+ start:2050 stop:3780 length:1731 start_codon:yes stop_codon:yes gene_type:complete